MQEKADNRFLLDIDYDSRVFGLDCYRAVAILLVVFAHGSLLLQNTTFEGFPYFDVVDGVELFFVLSGFLIGSILLELANSKQRMGVRETAGFWKRRWFRTLPNYYLVLLMNFLFVRYGIVDGDRSEFDSRFLVFSQNVISPMHVFLESWSLSIEEWFYIFLPLLVVTSSSLLSRKSGFLAAIAVLAIAPLLVRIVISNHLASASIDVDLNMWDERFRKTVATRLDTISYGVFAAWFRYYYRSVWEKYKNIAFVVGAILFVGSSMLQERNPQGYYAQTFSFVFPSIGAMLLLPKADSIKSFGGRLGRYITHISVISYSMYLINYGLVEQVIAKQFPPHGTIDSLFKYGAYWVVVIFVSTLLYKYFEKPVTDWRD